jgi:hypothetical protein
MNVTVPDTWIGRAGVDLGATDAVYLMFERGATCLGAVRWVTVGAFPTVIVDV